MFSFRSINSDASVLRACSTMLLAAIIVSSSSLGAESDTAPEWIRGKGKGLELRLRGRIERQAGGIASDATVQIHLDFNQRVKTFDVEVTDGSFEFWLPVNQCRWYTITLDVLCPDGARCSLAIPRLELRERIINGLTLQVERPSRKVAINVQHDGKPIQGATVRATTQSNTNLRATSGNDGVATLELLEREQIARLTAWSDGPLVGGFQFGRKPERDANADSQTIELFKCVPHEVLVQDTDGNAVEGVELQFEVSTPPPEYNFIGGPDEQNLVTNDRGIATYLWFPRIEAPHHIARVVSDEWVTVSKASKAKRSELVVRPAAKRQFVTGQLSAQNAFLGGFNVRLGTFQAEEANRIDFGFAFSDASGEFSVEVLPDATYCAIVEDKKWVSPALDLIPYESASARKNPVSLVLSPGIPARVVVTSGGSRRPLRNIFVNLNSVHRFQWRQNSETRSGSLGRDVSGFTNDLGIIEFVAPPGKLEAGIYQSNWRVTDEIDIQANSENVIRMHRKVDEKVSVTGTLIPSKTSPEPYEVELSIGAIDGKSGDQFALRASAPGEFEFATTATKLGVLAYSSDQRFAGSALIKDLTGSPEIRLLPTNSYRGRIVDHQGAPVVDHKVTATIELYDERNFETAYPTIYSAKRFVVHTDRDGRFRFESLPCKTQVLITTDPLDRKPNRYRSIERIFLLPEEERTERLVVIGEAAPENSTKSIVERLQSRQRDCRLGDFHLMVILADRSITQNDEFIERRFLDNDKNELVASYLQVIVDPKSLLASSAASLVTAKNWPPVNGNDIFACVYDSSGKELGRAIFDSVDIDAGKAAHTFVERHAPAQKNAVTRWEEAFKAARENDKRVWARTGQRYCGPCFVLSRWIDDHREVLEKDFVFLKIDDVRDLNGPEVAERLTLGRSVGVPFHAMFDADGTMIVDSYGPIGNIGAIGGIEGKRHFRKMLETACRKITAQEIESLLESIAD